jgi:hypothetical protein
MFVTLTVFKLIGPSNDGRRHGRGTYLFNPLYLCFSVLVQFLKHLIDKIENNCSVTEIIGGMLDLEPRFWRNPRRENFEAQKSKVLAFGAMWKEYDFTRKRSKHQDSSSSSSSSSDSDDEGGH